LDFFDLTNGTEAHKNALGEEALRNSTTTG
jgi:hypothetical protein